MRVTTVLIWEGLANVALMVIKFIVGLHTGSAVILSDALHSFADLANNGIAYVMHRVSSAPPDHDHPYGHQKYEQLAVFCLAVFLSVVAVELMINAIQRENILPEQSGLAFIVMLIALAINISVTIWEKHWAVRLNSNLLHADASHTLSDVFVTFAAIAGWQLAMFTGWVWLDRVFAIAVALLVLYLAYDLFRRAIPSLVDSVGHDQNAVMDALDKIPQVKEVKRIRSRQDGRGVAADIIVTVDGAMSTEKSHEVADAIETLLAEEFNIQDATVHIEPDNTWSEKR